MIESLLRVQGLVLESDGSRGGRVIALEIEELDIKVGDAIFVLANRKDGKSALRGALKAIFEFDLVAGTEVVIAQVDEPKRPPVRVSSFQKLDGAVFKELSGDPEAVAKVEGVSVLNYCDDPLLPHTTRGSGTEIIDRAEALSLTLMIGTDPDRVEGTFRRFLEVPSGRVLWLDGGQVFWSGSVLEYKAAAETLYTRYLEAHPIPEHRFLEAVKKAIE